MNLKKAISVLRKHNEWRRTPAHIPEDARQAMGDPREIGIAIDVLCDEAERLLMVLATVLRPEDMCDVMFNDILQKNPSAGAGPTP